MWRANERRSALCALGLALGALVSACSSAGGLPSPGATSAGVATPSLAASRAPASPAPGSASPANAPVAQAAISVALEMVVTGLQRPTYVTSAPGDLTRLYVTEKPGRIRTIAKGALAASPFLDVSSIVESGGEEQGLLGLAFHPDYATNGRFFVTYTAKGTGADTLAEYHADPATGVADPASGRVLLAVPDKYPNHNGGMIAFGPDRYLYLSEGDGGSAGNPDRNGQSLAAFLGKLLRLDVDGAAPYAIPPSNPFVAKSGAHPEIWAYGLRNPWRFSFDRATGDLWIADVGQDAWEEVDVQPAGDTGGRNYGWSVSEGGHCYRPASGCDQSGFVAPVFSYSHDGGACSITGGYVYRGKAIPALVGSYTFVDYCEGTVRALRRGADGTWSAVSLLKAGASISSFGEDASGEIYLAGDNTGAIYRLVPK